MLAIESLAAISQDYIMDVSHMGLISQIITETTEDSVIQKKLIKCLGEKNIHEIKAICNENKLKSEGLVLLASVYGKGDKVLTALKNAALSEDALKSVAELESINTFLKENGIEDKVNFDFSIAGNMKYYSAVVFKGYIKGISASVLSGGQYSKLLSRMGKKADAIGFAVYLDMLERMNTSTKKYDVDTVLIYEEGADISALSKNIKLLTDIGTTVLAVKKIPDIKYKKLLKFNGKGVEILENND